MSAIQLTFNLRTPSSAKTVHLIGSWDNYAGQLPLSKDSSKSAGNWKGTFRFQGQTLKQGQRYWYYYIIDSLKPIHDPSQPSTVEPTTKRSLNILDIPGASSSKPSLSRLETSTSSRSSRTSKRLSSDMVPHGRSLSPSKIISPRPLKPNAARQLEAAAASTSLHSITAQLANTSLSSSFDSDSDSDTSDVPSLTSSRSSSSSGGRSPISPASSVSGGSCCTCERFGITRAGRRVRLDCGGKRCGYYTSEGSSCGSESESEAEGQYQTKVMAPRGGSKRNGMVVRGR